MREIKFREWKPKTKQMFYADIFETCKWIHPGAVLMQFTGMTDRNGKEIYEGDLINAYDYGWGIKVEEDKVIFKNGMFMSEHQEIPFADLSDIEVIGNIYEPVFEQ